MLSFTKGDHRSFVLSTPRLADEGMVHLQIPFADKRVNELFSLKDRPKPWDDIRDILDMDGQSERFQPFLTPEPPRKIEPFTGDGIRNRGIVSERLFGRKSVYVN